MKCNYDILDSIAISINGLYHDIHNDYVLYNLVKIKNNDFQIVFKRGNDEWIDKNQACVIIINFTGVYFLQIPRENCLLYDVEEIGFKEKNDFNLDWLIDDNKDEQDYQIIFRLLNDCFIRIGCEKSICLLEYDQ